MWQQKGAFASSESEFSMAQARADARARASVTSMPSFCFDSSLKSISSFSLFVDSEGSGLRSFCRPPSVLPSSSKKDTLRCSSSEKTNNSLRPPLGAGSAIFISLFSIVFPLTTSRPSACKNRVSGLSALRNLGGLVPVRGRASPLSWGASCSSARDSHVPGFTSTTSGECNSPFPDCWLSATNSPPEYSGNEASRSAARRFAPAEYPRGTLSIFLENLLRPYSAD